MPVNIVKRVTKGSPLTHIEVDTNFENVKVAVEKLEGTSPTIRKNPTSGNLEIVPESIGVEHIRPDSLSNGLLTGAQQTAIINGPWTNKQFGGTLTGAVRGQMFADGMYLYMLIDDNTPVRTALA